MNREKHRQRLNASVLILGLLFTASLLAGCGGGGGGDGDGGGTTIVTGAKITAGGNFTCALTDTGGVKCWGAGFNGQIGDGGSVPVLGYSTTPVEIEELTSGVAAIEAGHEHACAVTTSRGAKCWGDNISGELGDGTGDTPGKPDPVNVVGLSSGVRVIAAGYEVTCAVTTVGGVKCWGSGYEYTPMDVVGLSSGVATIAAGLDSSDICVLTTAGGVKCWEAGSAPTDVAGLSSGVVAIAVGDHEICVLTTAGGVKCWGAGSTPTDVVGLTSGIIAIASGGNHTCAITEAGGVKCWGDNGSGQLGDGTTTDSLTPVDVVGLSSGIEAIAAGDHHTCALMTSGGVKCWGDNGYGRLGDGTTTDSLTPVDVVGF